MTDLNK